MADGYLPIDAALGTDGLTRVQRALVRALWDRETPVRCSKLVERLARAPGCPEVLDCSEGLAGSVGTDGPEALAYAQIDGALLAMAHPDYARVPLLAYLGNRGSADGWLPGAVYRMVVLAPVVR
ncbi:MAG TPA: hypothetical protein P5572_20045, partial [Phycisphaerae bacterium]|nr:hypothetical protein [Phycisphaerae bacterium]